MEISRLPQQWATPYLLFRWTQLGNQHDLTTITGRNRAISDMLDAIAPVEEEIMRNLMAEQVAEWGQVDKLLLLRAIEKRRRRGASRREQPDASADRSRKGQRWNPPGPEKQLVAWMLDRPWVCQMVGEMGLECFTDALVREIASALVRLNDEGEMPSASKLLAEKPGDGEWAGAVAALSQMGYDEREIEKAVTELIASLQLPYLKRQIDRIRARLREPLEREEVIRLTEELKELRLHYERLNSFA